MLRDMIGFALLAGGIGIVVIALGPLLARFMLALVGLWFVAVGLQLLNVSYTSYFKNWKTVYKGNLR